MKKAILGALLLTSLSTFAASPLWLRNSAISPDGQRIAFTYKGDIYSVPAKGGAATRLTTVGYNTRPLWSPDGSRLAFASEREDSNFDIYVMPSYGGTPVRLTTNTAKETPLAWAGNDTILFSANLMPAQAASQGGFTSQVYKVSATSPSGRPERVTSWPMNSANVDAQGRILFQDVKGYEDQLRKHEHSSGTADIWLLDGGKYTRLTSANVQDQNPVWGPDGKVYFISEQGNGTMNVHRMNADGSGVEARTQFTDHPVRHLSAANDGTLAFSWNGELYTLGPTGEPQKLNIDIITDDYTRLVQKGTQGSGVTCYSVSPNGKEVAFVLGGDVYVTSTEYPTTKRITNTPEQERVVDFAPDGRTLVYDSERDGQWQLFTAAPKDKEEKQLTYATDIVETPLYKSAEGKPAFQPSWSPDGKEVAFLEDRTELRVVDAKGKDVRTALDGKWNYSYTDGDISYEWAPDGKWFLVDYIGTGGWNNPDIALVKADGTEIHDLTQSGYSDSNAHWALDGKAMVWTTDRNGMRSHGSWGSQGDAYIMFFDGDAFDRFNMTKEEKALADEADKDKKKDEKKDEEKDKKEEEKPKKVKPIEFDLENAKYRTARLTPGAGNLGDYAMDAKGEKFYFLRDGDLWVRDLKEGETKTLVKGAGHGSIDMAGNDLFLGANGGVSKLDGTAMKPVSLSADREHRPYAQREYIFDHMHKQVKDKFYDEKLHGVDWQMYGDAYRRFLPHISNNYDFAEMLSEILGELNASHTGGRYYAPSAPRPTAELGAFFDPNYTGQGLKVTEIVKRGPLATKAANMKPGDVITAIEGQPIASGADYYPLLENRAGKRTRLTVKRQGGKEEQVTVKPISQGALKDLLYQRWVEHNQAVVDSVSGGRVAYVHVEGMDSPSFRKVFSELLGKYRNREAVVVDTRYNGGGWLHNDIALLLGGKEYVRFEPRGRYIGSEPFTQWTKPSVMLVNESNYSDAHGTPFVYQTLGIGEVIGAPVPGTMTAVWWERQVDPTIVFGIPQVTTKDLQGNVLENRQLTPDVIIYNTPENVQRGIDDQLIGATRRVMEKIQK